MVAVSANKAFVGFTIGSQKLQFLGKKTIYEPLKTELGLDHVQETSEEGYITNSIGTLISNARGIVLTVRGKAGKINKTGKLFVPIDKAASAADSLAGKNYGGWKIDKAYQSGDSSRSY